MQNNLNNITWKNFTLLSIFSLDSYGKEHTSSMKKGKKYPFVVAKKDNNGVAFWSDSGKHLFDGNRIVIVKDGDGGGGLSYYQENKFYANTHIIVLKPRIEANLDKYNGIFIAAIIKRNKHIYSHMNAITKDVLKHMTINLPCADNEKPDWKFMSDYIKGLKAELKITEKEETLKEAKQIIKYSDKVESFENIKMISFNLCKTEDNQNGIFNISGIGKEQKNNSKPGNIPLVSSGESNNGIIKYISNPKKIFSKNKLTLAKNGSVGKCFYQSVDFCTTSDVLVLENPNLSYNLAMFLIPIIEKQAKKYSWTNKINSTVLKQIKITLPAKTNSESAQEPDYEFMEQYIIKLKQSLGI